jgi:hypothetical protein
VNDRRIDQRMREAIDTLEQFSKESCLMYWLEAYKNIYGLTNSQCGFILTFLKYGIRNINH